MRCCNITSALKSLKNINGESLDWFLRLLYSYQFWFRGNGKSVNRPYFNPDLMVIGQGYEPKLAIKGKVLIGLRFSMVPAVDEILSQFRKFIGIVNFRFC